MLVTGCVPPSAKIRQFDVQTRLIEFPLDNPRKHSFLLGARERIWISTSAMRVETTVSEPTETGTARRDVPNRRVLWIFDFSRGEIWRREGKGEFRRTLFREYDYDLEFARRAALVDFVDSVVRDSETRALSSIAFYRGDGEVSVVPPGADRLVRARVGIVPGVSWKVVGSENASDRQNRSVVAERLFQRIMGMTREEGAFLARSIRGVPHSFFGRSLPSDGRIVEEQHEVLSVESLYGIELGFFEPPREDVERERKHLSKIVSWEVLFDWLVQDEIAERGIDSQEPYESGWLGKLLEYEMISGSTLPDTVSSRWALVSGRRQVELMRLALRVRPEWARERVLAAARGRLAAVAFGAVEALFLENDREAALVIVDILRNRTHFIEPVDHAGLVAWAIPRLRVASGRSYAEFERDITPLWSSSTRGGALPDPEEALAKELDHWIRWGEARRSTTAP